jgi:hypothetical protein
MKKNNAEGLVEFLMNSDLDSLLESDSAVIEKYRVVAVSQDQWDDFD